MASLRRTPNAALRRWVRELWSADGESGASGRPGAHEHVLPTGMTHVVLRLDGPPLRLLDPARAMRADDVAHAVIGGARASYYVRDTSRSATSVGALLEPGAALALLGATEADLAGRHTPLELVIGAEAVRTLTARLMEAGNAAKRLDVLERWLTARANPGARLMHAGVAHALGQLESATRIAQLVHASGLSHRRFISHVQQCTGLLPREHLHLLKFERATALALAKPISWAEIAAAAGYADQAHLSHGFRRVAGVTPEQWRASVDPLTPRHLAR